jgi:hypothetical protein
MVSPLNTPLGKLALGHQAEHLGQRPCRGIVFQAFDGTGPRMTRDRLRRPAPSARERGDVDLVPRNVIGEHAAGGVGESQAFAISRDPFAVGNADARSRAVPGEQDVVGPVDLVEISWP